MMGLITIRKNINQKEQIEIKAQMMGLVTVRQTISSVARVEAVDFNPQV
jgi:hypothetical protein